jgi:hypothetical protein
MNASFVIIGDVQDSRAVVDFPRHRNRVLARLSKTHRAQGWVDSAYAVTAWDEFQALLIRPEKLPWMIWDIYRVFQPMALTIGVGGGAVERVPGRRRGPINETATGEAFILARQALEAVATPRRGTGHARLAVSCPQAALSHALNAALRLVDVLVAEITETQWRVIDSYEELGRQDRVADALDRNESTISRSLAAARYWDLKATLGDVELMLNCSPSANSPGLRS